MRIRICGILIEEIGKTEYFLGVKPQPVMESEGRSYGIA